MKVCLHPNLTGDDQDKGDAILKPDTERRSALTHSLSSEGRSHAVAELLHPASFDDFAESA